MNKKRIEGFFKTSLLTFAITLAVIAVCEFAAFHNAYLAAFGPLNSPVPRWLEYTILCGIAVAWAYITDRFSLHKIVLYYGGFVTLWLTADLLCGAYFSIDIFFLRVALVSGAAIAMAHTRKLWSIDRRLSARLELLADSENRTRNADDLRVERGLKVLETVLPLSEAIVFRFDDDGSFIPVGRSRNDAQKQSLQTKNARWRMMIGLCDEAVARREIVLRTDGVENGSVSAALPLIYDRQPIGVLHVTVQKDFEAADQNLLEAFSGQIAKNFQLDVLRAKGHARKTPFSAFSTRSGKSRLDTLRLIEGALKEHNFGSIASSNLQEAHAIAFLDGKMLYVNRQMRQMARLDSFQINSLDLFGLLERFTTDMFNNPSLAIRRVLQTGGSLAREIYFEETGKTLKLQITLVKVPDENASIHDTTAAVKPSGFLVTIRDVSAQKENERLRSEMVSLMSHELRTPITSIQGFADLLLEDESIAGDSREFLGIISTESQRLSKMLSTFLSVSNLEQSDKQGVAKTAVRLDSLVSEVVEEMQDTARKKNIMLVEHPQKQIPPVAADTGLIRRAVSNLIDNAIRYSPERTSVIISTILEADFLRVEVEDQGYGIPPAEREKIWQKFYRVAREGFDKDEGSTGLGLSLVKEIVEQHGGQVALESDPVKGSKFSFTLPRL